MNRAQFNRIIDDLNQYKGLQIVLLLDSEGMVIFSSLDSTLDEDEIKTLLDAWKDRAPSLNFMNERYAILKNEEIQLAAKNIAEQKGIAGSITNEGDYLLIQISKDTSLTLLEWSIIVNKLAWQNYS
ncbi:MAG: hypothetical protein BAJALOKI1v1_1050006 [Promethearchaeota archaeon]|nr:MAG: hypothetical protein BAJALOKI1v1_1050006 [Candidatus Lokiarchaeota archaeon]